MAEDGYSGVEVRTTPGKTEIIIMATRTQNVLGEKGKRIRELTAVVQKRFSFPEGSVELYAEKVATRGLCAIAQVRNVCIYLEGVKTINLKLFCKKTEYISNDTFQKNYIFKVGVLFSYYFMN